MNAPATRYGDYPLDHRIKEIWLMPKAGDVRDGRGSVVFDA